MAWGGSKLGTGARRPAPALPTSSAPARHPVRAGITINDQATPLEPIVTADGFLPYTRRGGARDAVPAAYCAINLLTDQLARLPRRVVDSKGMEVDHWLNALMARPSRIVNPHQFWQIMLRSYIAHGNSYAWIRRDFTTNEPIELVPALCNRAHFMQARRAPYVRYSLHLLGSGAGYGFGYAFNRHIEADQRDVIAFHGPGYDGLYSPSPIRYAAMDMLEAMNQVVEHQRNMIKEGVNSGLALTVMKDEAKTFQYEEYLKIKEIITDEYRGARNAGKPPFLPPGIDVTRVQAISALDLQLIELLKWGVEDMARVWGISPIRLGHYYEGMRVTGFEMQSADFERYSISPHTARTDSELTWKLTSVEDAMAGLMIAADTDQLTRGTLGERSEIADRMVAKSGVAKVNEGRAVVGLPPDPDGDRFINPTGTAPGAPSQGSGGTQDMGGNDDD